MPVIGKAGTLAQGTTPIVDRLGLQRCSPGATSLNGNPPIEVVVPDVGRRSPASMCRRSAPMRRIPNAAKLWMEYLYSDEGQLGWLKGYCHPVRFNDMAAAGKIPQDLLDKLPPAEAYAKAVFPTLEEQGQQGSRDRRLGQRRRRQRPVTMTDAGSAPLTAGRDLALHDTASRQDRRRPVRGAVACACRWSGWGLRPSSLFALLFLILPTMHIVVGAFQTPEGGFTLENIAGPRHADDRRRPTGSRSSSACCRRCWAASSGFAMAIADHAGRAAERRARRRC